MVHFGVAQTANTVTGYFPFGAYTNPYLSTVYNTSAITGGAFTLTGNLGQFGFEVVLAGTCTLNTDTIDGVSNKMNIYPNPAKDFINIELGSTLDNATISVYNTIGQIVIPSQVINTNSIKLNISSLAKGVYIIKVNNGDKEISNEKFIVE